MNQPKLQHQAKKVLSKRTNVLEATVDLSASLVLQASSSSTIHMERANLVKTSRFIILLTLTKVHQMQTVLISVTKVLTLLRSIHSV